ncbi:MAG: 50S ribosomal protein L18 [Candidatus Omnitrophica bacterium]|nr:50S ribosomal protein L18 [Candidatus Omnitrophota bacterium]MBU1128446.1 50S ribosomal protein L18 [Candidatus Omnitrophota bacterium]MBU1657186.1 50S ribosomal protein L18 [Candidatus Omnitrophota bacterium]MBU1784436.1 50S ribosomal protein L18 [Candidatus Omnitrophota bacterium]MBU1851639.1 50S ribosomal protein L18 [Candidatus Omnitrophota bacterium]
MDKKERKLRRKKSIRKKISGTAERPRMCISKSLRGLTVQIVDDFKGETLCGLSTQSKIIAGKIKSPTKKNMTAAAVLGEEVAKLAEIKGIKKVVLDRSGYLYHGVVKAFADSARKSGMEF